MSSTSDNSKLTKFAIVGVGEVGLPLVQALASATNKPETILVLSRSISKLPLLPEGVVTASIDYSKPESISAVLKEHGIEVLFSMITTGAVEVQNTLADAAKAGGVKLFIPSEYGFVTEGAPEGLFKQKSDFAQYLRSIDLPFIRFWTGTFFSWVPKLTGYEANGKVNIVGKGEALQTFTSLEDIAGFAAHVTTNYPLSKIANATFRLEGQAASALDIARIFKLPIEQVDAVPGAYGPFVTAVQNMSEKDQTNIRWDWKKERLLTEEEIGEEDAKKWWPGHIWKRLEDVSLQSP